LFIIKIGYIPNVLVSCLQRNAKCNTGITRKRAHFIIRKKIKEIQKCISFVRSTTGSRCQRAYEPYKARELPRKYISTDTFKRNVIENCWQFPCFLNYITVDTTEIAERR
jgi:hypothetical protein